MQFANRNPQNHPTQGNSYHPQTSICRCLIHKKCRNPTKDSCTKTTCDSLSPYVGIIQIRFRVKASAYSQPACASTPFFVFDITFVMICFFYNSFIIHACSQNASFLFCAPLKLSQIQLHSHIRYFAVSQLIFNIPTKSVVPLQ